MIEISLDEHDTCYSCGHDANIYKDEFAIVPYVKHEIIAIAPILGSSFNEKHDCNDVIINSLDVNFANNMQNPKKHLPYQCEFSDNGIVSSYAKGVYNYYDVQQIEEFVAFKGAYESFFD